MGKSEELFKRAKKVIPGGVNSPVRAYQAVGGVPRFISKADGARIIDEDGREYIDFVGSWGPLILGHARKEVLEAVCKAARNGLSFGAATRAEVEMAELIKEMVPSVEMVRLVNSGTEAVMSAVRLARGFTGRPKIIKFEGCYHGHSDSMLVKAGSGLMTGSLSSSAGIPEATANDTLVAQFNDIDSVARLFEYNPSQIAAVITELVPGNMGLVLPKEGFLQQLRRFCTENGTLLIADEVITGFRLGTGGAQELFGIQPDLTTFGKIIGGGLPVGAFGGRRDIMSMVAPCGNIYQAGTLSGNPLATAAGITQLLILKKHPEIYSRISALTQTLADELTKQIQKYDVPATVNHIGSLFCMFFTNSRVESYDDTHSCNVNVYATYFNYMLRQGIYLAPSQFEVGFISDAHTEDDIESLLKKTEKFFRKNAF
ncbi:glutamate-1-semialdehyde 2,1-aminomutase [Mahella sp.]|uniref:glutamate-1-semialdehyde 2,1-aminomutase n=1 Tax=Mahella sp. TaxID=2798721 RepID=UPI0025B96E1B|nr:glutamate-1-semialdehyde 2,1-aminomutase [Mahella sp.]MBZ4666726.1 glutamate-semialdehyde -aminomutase [Mahella sp.]MDK2964331.1 glutamate-semialdehyde -aminomutase [Verrucomicrobiota bacterium]